MKRALQALAALGAFAGALGSIDPREPKITGAPSYEDLTYTAFIVRLLLTQC